jgi:hypothetical protein
MDRSKDTYDMIKKHIIFEGKVYYQKGSEYIRFNDFLVNFSF